MDSFIAVAGWTQHASPQPSRPFGHFRSISSITKSPSPKPSRSPGKSPSTSELPIMGPHSDPTTPSLRPATSSPHDDDGELSTLPDPRSRTLSPAPEGDAVQHPDLDDEVATLSNKLINAINHQTTLDDTLSATRQELERSREQVRQLEVQNASQREMLAGDVWVRRKTVEEEKLVLLSRVANEKKLRIEVEQEKKRIEQELENLTTALFEEANKMVITAKEEARHEQEIMQRKNDQLKSQLADTESLLTSQQEQLAELKQVMEQMTVENEDLTSGTAPSSPGFSNIESKDDDRPASVGAVASPLLEPASPTYPTSLTHLIQPILRTDLSSFDDFITLARISRKRAGSRVSSGSVGGLNAIGLGIGGSTSSAHPFNASAASITTVGAPFSSSSPQSPNTPVSAASTGSVNPGPPLPALKETKFFKRVLAEDVEPTLRLDIAPGLSWLARRTVLNAMTEGSIVVEPIPTNLPFPGISKPQFYPCSLCGESRKDEAHLRTYRFRTSESDSAQRHPLCKYCLGRVRSTCDFLNFLRILKDGHWRTDDEDAEKAAWEESVRMREQMFWARIGGGVIPAGHSVSLEPEKSPRASHDHAGKTEESADVVAEEKQSSSEDTGTVPENDGAALETPHAEIEPPQTPSPGKRDSAQSLDVKSNHGSEKDGAKRLSITIPNPQE